MESRVFPAQSLGDFKRHKKDCTRILVRDTRSFELILPHLLRLRFKRNEIPKNWQWHTFLNHQLNNQRPKLCYTRDYQRSWMEIWILTKSQGLLSPCYWKLDSSLNGSWRFWAFHCRSWCRKWCTWSFRFCWPRERIRSPLRCFCVCLKDKRWRGSCRSRSNLADRWTNGRTKGWERRAADALAREGTGSLGEHGGV